MKIQQDDGISRGLPHNAPPVQGGKVDAHAQTSQAKQAAGDRVELSDRARALQVASTTLKQHPESQVDKVEQLKGFIKEGTYHVPGEKIAERLLGEGLFA